MPPANRRRARSVPGRAPPRSRPPNDGVRPPRPPRRTPRTDGAVGQDGTGREDPQPTDVQILLKMYGWLRDEINESYRRQHRIVMGQATLIGLAVGLQFGFDLVGRSLNGAELSELLEFALIAIPPLVVVSASLWLLEHNRVMRAGNYLQLLEYQINDCVDGNPLSWETWLRDPPRTSRLQRYASPHFVFVVCHFLVYPAFFLVTGVVSIAVVARWVYAVPVDALRNPVRYPELLSSLGIGATAYFVVLFASLVVIIGLTAWLIPHRLQDQSDAAADFDDWLSRRFDGGEVAEGG